MKKTFCDICGCEIWSSKFVIDDGSIGPTEVIIHREGRTLDICDACRNKLVRYAFKEMRDIDDPVNGRF